MPMSNGPWNTSSELTFIDGLGSWRDRHTPTPAEKIALYLGYLKGLTLRKNWTGLDRPVLEARVEARLAELKGTPQ